MVQAWGEPIKKRKHVAQEFARRSEIAQSLHFASALTFGFGKLILEMRAVEPRFFGVCRFDLAIHYLDKQLQ